MRAQPAVVASIALQLVTLCGVAAAEVRFSPVDAGHLTSDHKSNGGVTMADFDRDGNLDILVTAGYDVSKTPERQPSRLYWGDGKGGFALDEKNALTEAITYGSGSTWGDFDNDGVLDCFVSCQLEAGGVLARGLGGRKFEVLTAAAPHTDKGNSFSSTWCDLNSDGNLDLLLCNNTYAAADVPFLYAGDGKAGFTRVIGNEFVTRKASTGGASLCDSDNDGTTDLFAPASRSVAILYRNTGGTNLVPVALPALDSNPFPVVGMSWVDYNDDGLMDLSLASAGGGTAWLLKNNGSGFERAELGDAHLVSTNSSRIQWADFDNDGAIDCVVPNWGAGSSIYMNNGDATFRRVPAPGFTDQVFYSSSSALADHDNDGRIDLLIGQWPLQPGDGELTKLFHNDSAAGNWIKLDLRGTSSNRAAIGARVRLTAVIKGKERTQTREVDAGNGFRSQGDLKQHFGLGDATTAVRAEIRWPSGKTQVVENLAAGKVHVVTEP